MPQISDPGAGYKRADVQHNVGCKGGRVRRLVEFGRIKLHDRLVCQQRSVPQ